MHMSSVAAIRPPAEKAGAREPSRTYEVEKAPASPGSPPCLRPLVSPEVKV